MATFDHERAHMAANLVSDPPVVRLLPMRCRARPVCGFPFLILQMTKQLLMIINEIIGYL